MSDEVPEGGIEGVGDPAGEGAPADERSLSGVTSASANAAALNSNVQGGRASSERSSSSVSMEKIPPEVDGRESRSRSVSSTTAAAVTSVVKTANKSKAVPPAPAGASPSPSSVELYLSKIAPGLEEYACAFEENEVDMDAMRLMEEPDFREIGIPKGAAVKIAYFLECGKKPQLWPALEEYTLDQFLGKLGLSKYVPLFEEARVDLLSMTIMKEQDYGDMGIVKGPRLKILAELAKLPNPSAQSTSRTGSTSTTTTARGSASSSSDTKRSSSRSKAGSVTSVESARFRTSPQASFDQQSVSSKNELDPTPGTSSGGSSASPSESGHDTHTDDIHMHTGQDIEVDERFADLKISPPSTSPPPLPPTTDETVEAMSSSQGSGGKEETKGEVTECSAVVVNESTNTSMDIDTHTHTGATVSASTTLSGGTSSGSIEGGDMLDA